MCALFLFLFAVVGYMVASDWVRTVWQQIRFGRDFYGLFKADKQKWEEQTRSQEGASQRGVQSNGDPATAVRVSHVPAGTEPMASLSLQCDIERKESY
jgi:hypothetical protein